MTATTTKPAGQGSPRVKSWVYGVFNPLVEVIPMEIRRLENRDVTFNCDRRELTAVFAVPMYLSPQGRHVLTDLRLENPDDAEQFDKHDRRVGSVATTAVAAYETLTRDDEFRRAVDRLAKAYEETTPSKRVDLPTERVRAFAEHVVNNRGELHFLSGGEFWAKHRDELLAFRRGEEFRRLDEACEELLHVDLEFHPWLVNRRLEYCRTYDIPAAPLAPDGE